MYYNWSFYTMECVFESYLNQEYGHVDANDIPQTKEPVWILGKKYNPIQGEKQFFIETSIRQR